MQPDERLIFLFHASLKYVIFDIESSLKTSPCPPLADFPNGAGPIVEGDNGTPNSRVIPVPLYGIPSGNAVIGKPAMRTGGESILDTR